MLGHQLTPVIIWPTKGLRNKPLLPPDFLLYYREKGSWVDIDCMRFIVDTVFLVF